MTNVINEITIENKTSGNSQPYDQFLSKERATLGSSFGGVVFKQTGFPNGRKSLKHLDNISISDNANNLTGHPCGDSACIERFNESISPPRREETYCNVLDADIDRLRPCTMTDCQHINMESCLPCNDHEHDVRKIDGMFHKQNSLNRSEEGHSDESFAFFTFNENDASKVCKNKTKMIIPAHRKDYDRGIHYNIHDRFLKRNSMGDQEFATDNDEIGKRVNSARNSLDSSASYASDNVFHSRKNSASLTDITSVSSVSSCQSGSRDTKTSRMRFELRHGTHLNNSNLNSIEGAEYMTPLQRREKLMKDLMYERTQLIREKEEKDLEILSLKCTMEAMKAQMESEKNREVAEIKEKLRVCEKEKFEEMEELCEAQEELLKMDEKYTELKRRMSEKEEEFEDYLLDIYSKGQKAAIFEREEELEMLANCQKSRVNVREITRKLSRTELELAKWQGLKLEESYSKKEQPDTQADVTLNFLKDAFFHFLTGASVDSVHHLRAMITIFKYSDVQMVKIRKGLADFKQINKKVTSLNNLL